MSVVVVRCKLGSDVLSGIAMSVVPELLSVIDVELLMTDEIVVNAEIGKTRKKA
jgi:hypothetical protein